jgi:hypothetical protein
MAYRHLFQQFTHVAFSLDQSEMNLQSGRSLQQGEHLGRPV